MSNDTNYNLKLRLPNKARLQETKNFLTLIKPELCRFFQNMKLDPELSAQGLLRLLGIKKFSEVVTWFGPYCDTMGGSEVGPVKKVGDAYELEIQVWANEYGGKVWVSGPNGELADLLARFPGLQIEGKFVDEHGAGTVWGYEKTYEMDIVEYNVRDERNWLDGECAGYSQATKELRMAAHHGELGVARLRRLIREGADMNAIWEGTDFFSSLQHSSNWARETENPERLAVRLSLILKAGWKYKPEDETMREALFRYATELRQEEGVRSVCHQMAEMLLSRKPGKNEDAEKLLVDSLRSRDTNGLLGAMFLGADFREPALEFSEEDQAWLRELGFSVQQIMTSENDEFDDYSND